MTGPNDLDRNAYHDPMAREIQAASSQTSVPDGHCLPTIDEQKIKALNHKTKLPIPAIYQMALKQGILPTRYLRNYSSLSIAEQYQLALSCVAVVGAGGLGGQVLITLARLGVGRLIVIDPGRFEESNLNRQALCTPGSLDQIKVLTAQSTLQELNPGIEVEIHPVRLNPENRAHILATAHVAVDALDSVQDRLILEAGTKKAGIPMVHAAIDGFFGQLMTIYPQDPGLIQLYGSGADRHPSNLGNLPMTAFSVATLQAMEVLKILLGRGEPIRHKMLTLELEQGLLEMFCFTGSY